MAQQIQLRNGTAAQWTSANPILASGEAGVETDTGKVKYGNGSTAWTSLAYASGGTSAVSSVVGQTGAVTGTQILADSTVAAALTAKADASSTTTALAAKAPLASPALTGTPTAPTATSGANTTQIATTAFVTNAVVGAGGGTVSSVVGQIGTVTGSQILADTSVATALAGKSTALTRTAVKTANYTAAAGEYVPVDNTSGNVVLTLPTAPADKTRVATKMVIQGGTNTLGLACGGSDVLNKAGGSTTATLTLLNQGVTLEYQASTAIWTVINGDLPLSQLDLRYGKVAGSNTWTGTQDFTGATVAGLAGYYQYTLAGVGDYIETGNLTSNQNQLLEGVEYACPFFLGAPMTLDRIGVWLAATVGSAGAVVRLGVRAYNSTIPGAPGTLLADGGTVDMSTGAASFKSVTLGTPLALTAGIYWVSTTTQGGATTRPGIAYVANANVRAPGTTFTSNKQNIGVGSAAGVTGALPTSFGAVSFRVQDATAPWFALRRSA